MRDDDHEFMKEAISWANQCNPTGDQIPRVGAIIAVSGKTLGRGRRGSGMVGDDEHAEWNALAQVENKSRLPESTLYTTLEPCTGDVRSEPLKSCAELIIQHKIPRVLIGILDPNPGVTGKGLWRLQDAGVEVALFPHDLAQQIRAHNVPFIRTQQSWGAKIIDPTPGMELDTYNTGGRYPVRFTAVNEPTARNFLVTIKNGRCWPQKSAFRHIKGDIWEVDSHFGSTGLHELHLITASDLGLILINYHSQTLQINYERKAKITAECPSALKFLAELYPGIPIASLPKGLRSETSVTVTVVPKPGSE